MLWQPRANSAVAVALATSVVALVALVFERPGSARVPRAEPRPGAPAVASIEQLADSLVAQLDGGRAVIAGLEFVGGSDAISPSADAVLAGLAKAINATRGPFLIEAHVAPSGDGMADQWLTDRRAAAVRARLVAAGVPAARLFAMGFGGTRATRAPDRAIQTRIEVSRMP